MRRDIAKTYADDPGPPIDDLLPCHLVVRLEVGAERVFDGGAKHEQNLTQLGGG